MSILKSWRSKFNNILIQLKVFFYFFLLMLLTIFFFVG
jgi:hypothetical protein